MILIEANECLSELVEECRRSIGAGTDLLFVGFEYESSIVALMELVLQHCEAFLELTKDENLFCFVAASCARAAMEAATTIAWICQPKDIIEKEGRWLGYYSSIDKFHSHLSRELQEIDPMIGTEHEKLLEMNGIIRTRKIEGQDIPIEKKPSFHHKMKATGNEHLYSVYRELCEIVHIGPEMTMRFKCPMRFDGGLRGFRIERRSLGSEWKIPLLAIGWALNLSVTSTLQELGDSKEKLIPIKEAHSRLIN